MVKFCPTLSIDHSLVQCSVDQTARWIMVGASEYTIFDPLLSAMCCLVNSHVEMYQSSLRPYVVTAIAGWFKTAQLMKQNLLFWVTYSLSTGNCQGCKLGSLIWCTSLLCVIFVGVLVDMVSFLSLWCIWSTLKFLPGLVSGNDCLNSFYFILLEISPCFILVPDGVEN